MQPLSNSRTRDLRRDAAWMLAFVPLAIAFTWPLVARFTTAIAGERDSWQNLWNIVWLRRAMASGQNPFFTHSLWYPDGATLVFQTFDLPDAAVGALLVKPLGYWPMYNLLVLWTFIASGAAMYVLARATGSSRPASFFAGCAYTFSTYHFAHGLAHLHLLAMQWAPLYMLAFRRILDTPGWKWPVAGGVLLTLSSLSSWYYLIGLFVLSAAILVAWVVRFRGRGFAGVAARGALLCATYLITIGPLGIAMIRAKSADTLLGAHPASLYSADVESFFLPNGAQALSQINWGELLHTPRPPHWLTDFTHHYRHWAGNVGETAEYLGYILLAIVLAGLILRAPRVGGYLFAALVGAVLAVGTVLRVGGHAYLNIETVYAFLVRLFPLLDFMGMPMRLAWVTMFGLAAALAPSLDALRIKFSWWLLAPIASLAILEHAPHPFVTSELPTPKPMLDWAQDPTPFAVLDTCEDNRKWWHQTVHGHPIFAGLLTRTPELAMTKLEQDPVAGPIFGIGGRTDHAPFTTSRLDFGFNGPVAPGAQPIHFSLDLVGKLRVEQAGETWFRAVSDDGCSVEVDGRRVIDLGGAHPALEQKGSVTLNAGEHTVKVHYEQLEGGAEFRVWWTPVGKPERILGGPDVVTGFTGTTTFRRDDFPLSREGSVAHLRALNVRYVVQDREDDSELVSRDLALKQEYEGEGVRIYRVP